MKLDRLMGMLTLLLQTDKVTAPELAKRFDVSVRTILRDVDALCLAGIPIVTTRGGNGGISIMDGYKINQNVLTVQEMQHVIAGLKSLDSVSKTSSFDRLMTKIAPNNAGISQINPVVIDLASHYKDSLSEKIALFQQAIAERSVVSFQYYYEKGDMRRTIEPYAVEYRWNAWYIFGYCQLRDDFRRFKLSRLWDVTQSDQLFSLRPVPPEKAKGEEAFSPTDHMTVLFSKKVRYRLIEEYGPHCYEEREDGLLFAMEYTRKEWAFSWLLGFGDQAEILEPRKTRQDFKLQVDKLFNRYHGT